MKKISHEEREIRIKRQNAKVDKLISLSNMLKQDISEELQYSNRSAFYDTLRVKGLPLDKEIIIDKMIEIEALKSKLEVKAF